MDASRSFFVERGLGDSSHLPKDLRDGIYTFHDGRGIVARCGPRDPLSRQRLHGHDDRHFGGRWSGHDVARGEHDDAGQRPHRDPRVPPVEPRRPARDARPRQGRRRRRLEHRFFSGQRLCERRRRCVCHGDAHPVGRRRRGARHGRRAGRRRRRQPLRRRWQGRQRERHVRPLRRHVRERRDRPAALRMGAYGSGRALPVCAR